MRGPALLPIPPSLPGLRLLSCSINRPFGATLQTGVNLMTDPKRLSARLSCVSIALVAISMAIGAPAVRAQSDTAAASWGEIPTDV